MSKITAATLIIDEHGERIEANPSVASRFSPALQELIDANRKRFADVVVKDEPDDLHQLAVLIKAAEVACAASPDHFHDYAFAAGYVAALVAGDDGAERARAIAATL
ncbi:MULTISPECIES: hypothetical protein [Rhizobium]|uniref:Uncharacterized protein n=1 Tax=Rhizobium favelukesii TaxID=348824 RepID=W6RFZ6_9HYPH|nr:MULTISPECIES: hypothetical protein [Rhizobium]MCS0460329.1 hypothetical protein [Rhizobium favelukesii]UFS80866.1 hypothetical protein LPB79_21175 [Rhizobium sp. T136]CDM57613.1 putative predicted protein [Rhizobium favelukesii]